MKSLLCSATMLASAGLGAQAARAADVSALAADPGRPVAFAVFLPLRNRDKLEGFVADLHNPASPNYHKWLVPAEFGLRFGPETSKVAAVAASLRARGFNVSVQTRSLHVTGTAAQVESNFGAHLLVGRTAEGMAHVMQDHAPNLPPEIAATGAQIFSFSPHVAHLHSRRVTGPLSPNNRYSTTGGYWFDDLKQAYAYPSVQSEVNVGGTLQRLDGTGATIGVLMSSDVLDGDIQEVFDHENWSFITGKAAPALAGRVYVNGGATVADGAASGALDEASLDTQEEITGAPGANVILYDIPDLSDGSVSAGYTAIVEANTVDLVSSSFGGCEKFYAPVYNGGQNDYPILEAEHEVFLQGNAQGITFLASSGDSAGKGCLSLSYLNGDGGYFSPGVETPASDPAVTAVGGTNIVTTYKAATATTPASLNSAYVSENAWSDEEIPYDPYGVGTTSNPDNAVGGFWGAGGGYSAHFPQPAYQTLVTTGSTAKRAVPDIGMQVGGCPGGIAADYNSVSGTCNGGGSPLNGSGNTDRSYVFVSVAYGQGGGLYGLIGTSVASPEFAGAVALLIEKNGRQGNLNYRIYSLAKSQAAGNGPFYHTNIPGYNGLVKTNLNNAYSLSVGVGTPIVNAFIGATDVHVAGEPQSTSNP